MRFGPVAGVTAWLLAGVSSASAQSNGVVRSAVGELTGEIQVCSAYFLIGSTCFKEDATLSSGYRQAFDRLGLVGLSSGRAVGMSDEAYATRASLFREAMIKSAGHNCTNIAVLQKRYAEFCRRLSTDVNSRLTEWIACIQKRSLSSRRDREQSECDSPGLP